MRSAKEAAGYRHARLEGILLEEIRSLLRDDVSDPELFPVRISSVSLSVDYRHVRIHYIIATKERFSIIKDTEKALLRCSAFLRNNLALDLDLKRTPDLRFICDGLCSIEEGAES